MLIKLLPKNLRVIRYKSSLMVNVSIFVLTYNFLGLYLMIHCKSCNLNVHWNCIGTDTEVMRKYKHKKPYYFFECDKCRLKELNKENPGKYKFNFNQGTTVMQ
jgi:hypothetical protein